MFLKNIKGKIRLFKVKNKELYLSLHKMLGFYPGKIELYELAFLHRSLSSVQEGKRINNERLEFLGDAILDSIISDLLYIHFPNKTEGFLTNMRSKIVQRDSLNNIALSLGIDKWVTSQEYVVMHNRYIYGNALEAFVGAIYLDKGYLFTHKFVEERIIKKHIELDKLANKELDFKSRLMEWGQKNRLAIEFNLMETLTDKAGGIVFQTSVSIEGNPLATGIGNTKKLAQQAAAKTLLKKIHKDKNVKGLITTLREK